MATLPQLIEEDIERLEAELRELLEKSDATTATPASGWSIERAIQYYNLAGWGAGFFSVNEKGHVVVHPMGGARKVSTVARRGAAHPAPAATGEGAVAVLDYLLARAVQMRASDLHIEPWETSVAVRARVNGVLAEVARGHLVPVGFGLLTTRAGRPKLVAVPSRMTREALGTPATPLLVSIRVSIAGRGSSGVILRQGCCRSSPSPRARS